MIIRVSIKISSIIIDVDIIGIEYGVSTAQCTYLPTYRALYKKQISQETMYEKLWLLNCGLKMF